MRLLSAQNLPSKVRKVADSAQGFVFTGKNYIFDEVAATFEGATTVLSLVVDGSPEAAFHYE